MTNEDNMKEKRITMVAKEKKNDGDRATLGFEPTPTVQASSFEKQFSSEPTTDSIMDIKKGFDAKRVEAESKSFDAKPTVDSTEGYNAEPTVDSSDNTSSSEEN